MVRHDRSAHHQVEEHEQQNARVEKLEVTYRDSVAAMSKELQRRMREGEARIEAMMEKKRKVLEERARLRLLLK